MAALALPCGRRKVEARRCARKCRAGTVGASGALAVDFYERVAERGAASPSAWARREAAGDPRVVGDRAVREAPWVGQRRGLQHAPNGLGDPVAKRQLLDIRQRGVSASTDAASDAGIKHDGGCRKRDDRGLVAGAQHRREGWRRRHAVRHTVTRQDGGLLRASRPVRDAPNQAPSHGAANIQRAVSLLAVERGLTERGLTKYY